ncbi:AraC family transcriptional regulator [uncultured Lactobacillus sp.]|uniref:AraC family transcriptional regulator n=1 Tax=uncultured Lactobacillus sp. TaxID=153152 RepID=UPI002805B314|nr:AraC family transcriptional regulator [uncultured Lactobacillus sp.]
MNTVKFLSVEPKNKKLPFNCFLHDKKDTVFIPKHWHDTYEINYVIEGKNQNFYIDGKTFDQRKNEIVCVNPYEIHGLNLPANPDRLALTLMIPLAFLSNIGIDKAEKNLKNRIYEPENSKYIFLIQLFKELAKLKIQEKKTKETNLTEEIGLGYAILGILFKDFVVTNTGLQNKKDHSYRYIEEALSWIDQHYQEPITISGWARNCSLSESYFSHIFKKSTGSTPMSYLKKIRLVHARQSLQNEEITMTELAAKVGFANVKAMNDAFKEITGLTPYQYKLSKRKAGFDSF